MKFSIGERIKISERAYENGVFSRTVNRKGTIVGYSRDKVSVYVKWDERKTPMSLAEIFVEKLQAAEGETK